MVMSSDENIEYIGPAIISDGPAKEVTEGQVKDERDLSTLEKVQARLYKKMKSLDSIRSLTVSPREGLTTEQQLAVNKEVIAELTHILNMINKGIRDVKENQNGR